MIILYTFGPQFGLPDPSPFVLKTMVQLRMAGLDFTKDSKGFLKAPKGKLPFIDDDGEIIADSTFIRRHIEKKYGFDFDAGLSVEQRAIAWALERMCEDHLYFALLHERWAHDANFARGPAQIFNMVPAPVRGAIRVVARHMIVKTCRLQGTGRHSPSEIAELAERDLDALATLLGGKPYLFGDRPCGADATLFSFVAHALVTIFEGPVHATAAHANLVAYRDRLMALYFPKTAA